jgi:putative acetyltransferase
MNEIAIIEAESPEHIEQARALFREYERWIELDLCFQGFEDEVRNLPGKYAPPEGRLLLAFAGTKPAGCIALRKLSENICEMKRLFVREEFRRLGIGRLLIEKLLAEAAAIGYEKMRLDTFPPKMSKAVELYKTYGFYEIEPYYDNPFGETLYMEAEIKKALTAEEG